MGISTLSSYQGAQIFEAIGIDQMVIDKYFTGTASRIRGVGLREIAEEALIRHERGFGARPSDRLDVGGHVHYRATGERHLWNPKTVASLQKAVRVEDAKSYEEYAADHQRARASVRSTCAASGIWLRRARRSRSKRSSRRPKSSSALPPARCRSAASRKRRTRTSPSP